MAQGVGSEFKPQYGKKKKIVLGLDTKSSDAILGSTRKSSCLK
jgi:hypothetical protein